MIITNASKKTNQADTDQFTQAAQGWCPAAEVEQTAPSIQIDLVYINSSQEVLSFKNESNSQHIERTAEPTKPICKIGEIVYILKIIYLILKLLVRNQYKL